jgi:hypothetical protein
MSQGCGLGTSAGASFKSAWLIERLPSADASTCIMLLINTVHGAEPKTNRTELMN